MKYQHINTTWTTVNIYVDIETGEQISKYVYEICGYKTIKKYKNVIHKDNGKKLVEITNECRKAEYKPQQLGF